MKTILFKEVKCTKYLEKNKQKYIMANDVDEHEEYDGCIKLSYGEEITQPIYKIAEKIFSGICVGVYSVCSERLFESLYDDFRNENYINVTPIKPITVAKVYYANNKSRLVPISCIALSREKDKYQIY